MQVLDAKPAHRVTLATLAGDRDGRQARKDDGCRGAGVNHSEKPTDSTTFYSQLLGWKSSDGPPA